MINEANLKEVHDYLEQRRKDRAPDKLERLKRRDRRLTYRNPNAYQWPIIITALSGIGYAMMI